MSSTILLADDSPTIRKIVELTFQDSSIRVESVASGALALEKLDELQPDLLLADVIMPEPGGYELCDQVKGSERPIPVVLLTGAFEAFDADRARECGADDRLVKPFEAQMLRDTVERLLQDSAIPAGVPEGELVHEDSDELDALSAELEESRPDTSAPAEAKAGADDDDEQFYEVAADWGFDGPAQAVPVEMGTLPGNAGGDGAPTAEGAASGHGPARLTPADVEAVADAVVRRLSGEVVRELAQEMLPDIARELVRQRIQELEDTDD